MCPSKDQKQDLTSQTSKANQYSNVLVFLTFFILQACTSLAQSLKNNSSTD